MAAGRLSRAAILIGTPSQCQCAKQHYHKDVQQKEDIVEDSDEEKVE